MVRQTVAAIALLLTVLPLTAQPAHTQTDSRDHLLVVDHYLDWEDVGDPQLSPDGSQIVYTRSWVNKIEDKWESALWIISADGSRNRFLTSGSGARWSPDATRIAYLAEGEPKGTQLFVRWMDAEGATSQVTHVTERPGSIRWSPDSKWIALAMRVPAEPDPEWKIALPKSPEGAEWTKAPRIVERMHFKQDRIGFLKAGYTHLFVVPAEGGTPRQLTHGDWNVGNHSIGIALGVGLDWTPDGEALVFDGLREEDADVRYRESHIYKVNVADGEIAQITSARGPWTNPIVAPDGNWIAFAGYEWTDQTYRASDLHLINIDGSGLRKISGDLDRDPGSLHWSADGKGVYFTAGDHGTQNVYFAAFDGGVRQVTQGNHMFRLGSDDRKGRAAGVLSSAEAPWDVVTVNLKRPRGFVQLTDVNADVLAGIELGEVEEIWYPSSGDTQVQGWIVKPPGFDSQQKYPLILHIHGGPHAMYNVAFSYSFQNYAANGYVVLYTNPRGSTGYGTEFGNAIDNAYPSVDYDDLMAGVDAVIDLGYVDTDRLFVTGCSGGGVLSSWVIGQTDRFAAAAVRCPVVNWISFAGTPDITQWAYHRFDGYFWENPEKWLAHSPLMHVGKVKTPTVLMTGELDLRTPMSQTEEYYEALKVLGVPTAMIQFKKEYHGTMRVPSNYMRTQLYIMNWFERYGGDDRQMAETVDESLSVGGAP